MIVNISSDILEKIINISSDIFISFLPLIALIISMSLAFFGLRKVLHIINLTK